MLEKIKLYTCMHVHTHKHVLLKLNPAKLKQCKECNKNATFKLTNIKWWREEKWFLHWSKAKESANQMSPGIEYFIVIPRAIVMDYVVGKNKSMWFFQQSKNSESFLSKQPFLFPYHLRLLVVKTCNPRHKLNFAFGNNFDNGESWSCRSGHNFGIPLNIYLQLALLQHS